MTDLPPAPPMADPHPRASDEFRSLRRSRSDRVVAGVLGGLGRRLGIDPVVLRVATVVLAIFGGVGVLLYAVAWLLVPSEDEDSSILDRALGRGGRRGSGTVPLAFTLAVVGLIAATGIIAGSWDSGVLLVLAAAGLFVLLRRRDDEEAADDGARDDGRHGAAFPEQAWFETPQASGTVPSGTVGAGGRSDSDAAAATVSDAAAATPDVPGAGWPEGPDWGAPRDEYLAPAQEPVPPAPAKAKSILGPVTFCAALVAVGVLAVNDVYWAEYPAAMYVAVPLGIVAIGLLIGAWYGRSRGLIFLGILLSLALGPATWASQWDYDNVGDATYRYTSVAELPVEPASHGAGTVHYDLSDLRLTSGDPASLTIEMGAGDLTVTVPEDADVTVNASVGAGDLTVFGESRDGLGQSINITDDGSGGRPGLGEIVLDIDLGMGDLEVTR